MTVEDKLQRERDYLLVIGVQNKFHIGVTRKELIDSTDPDQSIIVDTLNIKFSINKNRDNKNKSNNGTISIYNLSHKTIAFLNTNKLVNVSFYAGYKESGIDSLVLGNVTDIKTEKSGVDIITTLTLDENFVAMNNTRVSSTIPNGKTIEDVIEVIRKAMSEQSVSDGGPEISKGEYSGINKDSKVLYGYSLTGSARQKLNEISLAYRIDWSIDAGRLNISDSGSSSASAQKKTRTYILTPETGLIGIPHFEPVDSKRLLAKPIKKVIKDKNGIDKTITVKTEKVTRTGVKFKALLNPFLRPGDLVKIECEKTKEFINSYYQIRDIKYFGELRGDDWYIDCVCDPVILTDGRGNDL